MLIDTNILVEIAKKQERWKECLDLLKLIKFEETLNEEVFITKFALHALEAMLSKFEKNFLKEILLIIFQDKLKVFDTSITDDLMTLSSMEALGFDFDDATQYFAANKLQTYIVTFDKSFQNKGIEIKTPAEVLQPYIEN